MHLRQTLWPVISDFKVYFVPSFVSIARRHTVTTNAKSSVTDVPRSSSAESMQEDNTWNSLWTNKMSALRRDDGAPFLKLQCWEASSQAYTVTDAYVVTRATHADMLVMCARRNPILITYK